MNVTSGILYNTHIKSPVVISVDFDDCVQLKDFDYDVFDIVDGKITLYQEMAIKSLQLTAIEIDGTTTTSLKRDIGNQLCGTTVGWSMTKTPQSMQLSTNVNQEIAISWPSVIKATDNASIAFMSYPLSSGTFTVALSAIENKTDKVIAKTASIQFLHRVLYGSASNVDSSITSASDWLTDFSRNMSSDLCASVKTQFIATAGQNQHFYYAVPTYMAGNDPSKVKFTVNGFTGGFDCIDGTHRFTNAYGYSTYYYVYKSKNSNLGTQTINVAKT